MTDQPTPTPEATTEMAPMSEELLAEMHEVSWRNWADTRDAGLVAQADATLQCLDEIKRLRAVVAERDAEIHGLTVKGFHLSNWLRHIKSAAESMVVSEPEWRAWLTEICDEALKEGINGEAVPELARERGEG